MINGGGPVPSQGKPGDVGLTAAPIQEHPARFLLHQNTATR